jgi:metal transporter CNNM
MDLIAAASDQWNKTVVAGVQTAASLGEEEHLIPFGVTQWYIRAGLAFICVICAALAAGLTMGMVSLSPLELAMTLESKEVDCETEEQKKNLRAQKAFARKVMPIVRRHHLLLVTLLLLNAAANEALPIFLDSIVPSYIAVILSVSFVLIFGEIVPSAIFTGPSQLKIASKFTYFVWFLIIILSPIAYPIAKVLDLIFGHDHLSHYARSELMALFRIHGDHTDDARESTAMRLGGLTEDEITICQGVLDMSDETTEMVMTPQRNVFMLRDTDKLDSNTMADIMASGHSRIPVYSNNNRNNVMGILLVKKLIVLSPEDAKPVGDFVFRQPLFAPPDTPLLEMLNMFQEHHKHLAIITTDPEKLAMFSRDRSRDVPADLKVLGLITAEDVMERIIHEPLIDETDQGIAQTNLRWSRRIKRLKLLAERSQEDLLRGSRTSRNDPSKTSRMSGFKSFKMEEGRANVGHAEEMNAPLLNNK